MIKRLKLPKISEVLKFLFLVISTSLILISIYIALPQTEKLIKNQRYDLHISDLSIWSKEYTVELKLEQDQIDKKWQHINRTKNIISNRLSQLGVSNVNFETKEIDNLTTNLIITVKSNIDKSQVESLVQSRGLFTLVVKKDDVTFNSEENPYAQFLPDNYTQSDLTRKYFRTVYITKLKTTSGDYAYFGIFKPWIWNNSKYYNFLAQNSGKEGGINSDGFVTPVQIPVYELSKTSSATAKPVLSVGIGSDPDVARIQGILYNSGEIPISYTSKESKDIEVEKSNIDYTRFGIFVGAILITSALLFSLLITKSGIFSITPYIFTLVLFIDYLKLTETSISITEFVITSVFCLLLSIALSYKKYVSATYIYLGLFLLTIYFLKPSFSYTLFPLLIAITALNYLGSITLPYYSKLIKSYFIK